LKRTLAALIAGIVLGSAGVASAIGYWSKSSPGIYSCQGSASGLICKTQSYRPRYSVLIQRRHIALYFNGSVIFGCDPAYASGSCTDFRGP
jgi:hypothetical protein